MIFVASQPILCFQKYMECNNVHTSACCCGWKGVDRHREFAKRFLAKEMLQTDQINPTEIMHPPKSMVPSCPSTLSLIVCLLLSSVGMQIPLWISEGGLCWPCTSVLTWLPHTEQMLHTSMAWWDLFSFPWQLQSAITIPSKASLLQNSLGRKHWESACWHLLRQRGVENDQQTALGHILLRVAWPNRGVPAKQGAADRAKLHRSVSTGLVTQQTES